MRQASKPPVTTVSEHPSAFLRVFVSRVDPAPGLTALCAGFEQGAWRAEQFAEHLFQWLPEFALTWRERQQFRDATAVELLRRAVRQVYASDQYAKRGEFGELILHSVARQIFESEPAISKLFFKDAPNDTVKGFDSVHVVPTETGLELWLGEAKFYGDVSDAIRAAVSSLTEHMAKDYLRTEFAAITNKIDTDWPHADALKRLLHPNTSLDEVFEVLRLPVLITYDSTTVAAASSWDDPYPELFCNECERVWKTFSEKTLPPVHIHLLLVPLGTKEQLLKALQEKLEAWRKI